MILRKKRCQVCHQEEKKKREIVQGVLEGKVKERLEIVGSENR